MTTLDSNDLQHVVGGEYWFSNGRGYTRVSPSFPQYNQTGIPPRYSRRGYLSSYISGGR